MNFFLKFVVILIYLNINLAFGCIPTSPEPKGVIILTSTTLSTSTSTTSTSAPTTSTSTSTSTSTTSTTTTTTTTTTTPTCPTGWVEQSFSGVAYCYLPIIGDSTTALSQPAAQAACVAQGGNLASIHSQAENDFIWMLMVSTNAGPAATYMNRQTYIGLELAATAGTVYTYAWNDGTPVDFPTGNPWTMNMGPLPWDPTFGNPDGIPCVFIYNNNNGIPGTAALGEWNDVTCSTPLYSYICKKPLI